MVAVQHVTVTPFRVVDEINQGMDRINERKVFIQMVDAACRPGTPQCFMFTPKLLPDLPYTHDVMPMTIFNGMHNEALTGDYESIVRIPMASFMYILSVLGMQNLQAPSYIPVENFDTKLSAFSSTPASHLDSQFCALSKMP